MKFRSRILRSFFAVILCLGITLTLFNYLTVTRRLEKHSTAHLVKQVTQVQQGLDQFQEQCQREMLLMSLSPVLGSTQLEQRIIMGRLQQFRDTLKVFDHLSLVARDGRVMADTAPGQIGTRLNTESFRLALNGATGYLLGFDPTHRQATMQFHAPLRDQAGRIHRVLLATVQLEQVRQIIASFSDSLVDGTRGAFTELLSPDGRRLYSNLGPQGLLTAPSDWPLLRSQLPRELIPQIHRVVKGAGRIEVVATTGPVGPGEPPWILRASIPTATLFHEPRQQLWVSLGVMATLLLVSLFWMRSIAVSLSQPLELLGEAAEHAGKGDFSVAENLAKRQDEFRPLFEAF